MHTFHPYMDASQGNTREIQRRTDQEKNEK